jgi:hypothetical protein
MASLHGAAGGDISELEKKVAAWYDATMDRVAGWYKRKTHTVLFVLGLTTAIGFNLDTFRIASRLWTNAALRAELVGAAAQRVSQGDDNVTLQEAKNTLQALPFGWRAHLPHWHTLINWDAWRLHSLNLLHDVVAGLPGWLVTATAVSLGAPFWFDLLQKLVNVRGAGQKPAPMNSAARTQSRPSSAT